MLKALVLAGALALSSTAVSAAVVSGGAPSSFVDFAAAGTTDAASFTFDANGTAVTATGGVFHTSADVRRTASGLGVNGGFLDLEKDEVGASEKLTLDFDRDFNLAAVVIGDLTKSWFKTDKGTVGLANDGSVFATVDFSAAQATGELATIAFAGGAVVDALHFTIQSGSKFSAQNFAVRGISEVPVPAALPLLASAMGGLAWMQRRRQRS